MFMVKKRKENSKRWKTYVSYRSKFKYIIWYSNCNRCNNIVITIIIVFLITYLPKKIFERMFQDIIIIKYLLILTFFSNILIKTIKCRYMKRNWMILERCQIQLSIKRFHAFVETVCDVFVFSRIFANNSIVNDFKQTKVESKSRFWFRY